MINSFFRSSWASLVRWNLKTSTVHQAISNQAKRLKHAASSSNDNEVRDNVNSIKSVSGYVTPYGDIYLRPELDGSRLDASLRRIRWYRISGHHTHSTRSYVGLQNPHQPVAKTVFQCFSIAMRVQQWFVPD